MRAELADGIKNILFDFGNVLLDIDMTRSVAAFERLGLPPFRPEAMHPHNTGIFLQLELGLASEEQFVAALQATAPADRKPSARQLLDAWNALLLPYRWERFELLDRLRASGYGVFLLSNTNWPHRRHFIAQFNRENPAGRPFESYFDRVFYSDAMHLRKPDAGIYLEALRQAGIEPRDTLFIDDNLHNVEGALAVGLKGYHLAAPETVLDLFESAE